MQERVESLDIRFPLYPKVCSLLGRATKDIYECKGQQ